MTRRFSRLPRWAGASIAGFIGLIFGIAAAIALGGREGPEWLVKLALWTPPIIAIVMYFRWAGTQRNDNKQKF